MKLADFQLISGLTFDLAARELRVRHQNDATEIIAALIPLNLDAKWISSTRLHTENLHVSAPNLASERILLWQVLGINLFFFGLESILGYIFHSIGLVADGLDMLADAFVYTLALLAVGSAASRKRQVAKISGNLQFLLAVLGFAEVLRRFFFPESIPDFTGMMLVSVLALAGNAACLVLLQRSRSREAHMQASLIFTSNDVLVNLGVILAGALVWWTHTALPDLIIGTLVFVLVLRGALAIRKL